jgi:predicted Fe-Mo cluster-binding NifX family protein
MRIAVASQGKDPDSQIAPVAGRAPYYLIFENQDLDEVMENPYVKGGGGAGPGVAKILEEKKVDLVLLQQAGANMEQALRDKGIQAKTIQPGKVRNVLAEVI